MENKRNQLKPGDTIKCIKTFWNSETQTRIKEGYIVKNMTQFGIDCLSHPECWEKVESTREQASKWFSSKSYLEQHELSDKYFESKNPSLLTIEQVLEIYDKEILEPKRQKEWI